MDKLIQEINRLEMEMLSKRDGEVHLTSPHILSESIARISIYLSRLGDQVSEQELNFKLKRAARYDRLLKEGFKTTQIDRELKYDQELIKHENEVERLWKYIKRTEGVISSIQTHIRVKSTEASNGL